MKTMKEIWITAIIDSAENIHCVEADVHLFENIQSRLQGKIRQLEHVSSSTVWLAAASIALLIALNFKVLSSSSSPKQHQSTSSPLTENSFDIYSNT